MGTLLGISSPTEEAGVGEGVMERQVHRGNLILGIGWKGGDACLWQSTGAGLIPVDSGVGVVIAVRIIRLICIGSPKSWHKPPSGARNHLC